jgi:hypothetical protein
MKKIAFTGIVIFLVLFMVTCEDWFPGNEEYTDVVYSEDGAQITVYLDGTTVPLTKEQRAMSKNLSKMAYDFLEVIFIHDKGGTDDVVARASWELGQSAGISGVSRAGAGVDYAWNGGITGTQALIFVGRKDGKTLLGIGKIQQVDREPKAFLVDPDDGYITPPTDAITLVTEKSQSVTFWVQSIKTGLLIGDEKIGGTSDIEQRVAADSFITHVQTPPTPPTDPIRVNATRSPLGNASYPLYPLPIPVRGAASPFNWTTHPAAYTFAGAAETYKGSIVLTDPVNPVLVERRFPRYLDGGRYLAPKSNIDTLSEVILDETTYGVPTTTNLNPKIPLIFTPIGYGIFSFYIEIPCYMITDDEATNSGPDAEIWKIRTGLGSELYSIDDGVSSGGCVLMGVGVSSLDWLEIEWEWVK